MLKKRKRVEEELDELYELLEVFAEGVLTALESIDSRLAVIEQQQKKES